MRIIAFASKNAGPSYHRIIAPMLLLPDVEVLVTNDLNEAHFEKGCDLVMYNRILPDQPMAKLKELQKQYGFKICVDVDDFWELDESHVLYQLYQEDKFAENQIKHLKEADVVLTTHSRLADEIYPYNKNVHVCPNAIPKKGQFAIEREPYYLIRLFWQGSDTHGDDIKMLANPIQQLNGISPKIKMVMAGYTQGSDIWYDMAMDYTAETMHQYKLIPPANVSMYYEAYKEADICLVPLRQSRFNRHKSNLKVLEAANLGLPVIASEVHPYLGLPIKYAKTTGEWVKNIKSLVGSKRQRRDAGLELKEYCDKYFDFEKINLERKQILEHTAKMEKA